MYLGPIIQVGAAPAASYAGIIVPAAGARTLQVGTPIAPAAVFLPGIALRS